MKKPKPTTLIHLSGGLDSTFTLYDHLRNNPDEQTLVHHAHLSHLYENRLSTESRAVLRILDELRAMGLDNFEYHESWFIYGTLPRITIKDIQIIAMFSAIILKTPAFSTISRIKLPWHLGEVNHRIRRLFHTGVFKAITVAV